MEKRKLPARFARLTRRVAVIFVREPVAATAPAFAPSTAPTTSTRSATASTWTTASARTTKTLWSARWSAFALGPRFIHFQVASAKFLAVEASDSLGRFLVIGHLDEREAARAACFPIHGHVHARDLSKRFEQCAQIAFRGLEIHIADK
jgi:hypothetical protein